MKRYKPLFKETIYMNNAGERLLITVDLSKVPSMKKFVDDLYKKHKDIQFDKKATDLTDPKNAKIIIPNNLANIRSLKSVLFINDFYDTDVDKIMKNVRRY